MKQENIEITIKAYNTEMTLKFCDTASIDKFYDKLELLALFVGYSKVTIDKEVNRLDSK